MLTFAVVVSRSGGPVPRRVLDRLHDRRCADVPFAPAHHLVWSNENGTIWFAGWQDASESDAPAHHWHVDDARLTAFSGHLWPRGEGWQGDGPWAAQLADRLRVTPLTDGADDLAGIYAAVSLHARGRSTVAADPLGVGLVYWGEGSDVIAISTHAPLAAGVLAAERGGDPKRDPIGAGWIVYGIRAIGLRTGFEQVTVLPQGAVVDIDSGGAARLRYPSPLPWRAPIDGMAPEEVLEDARREMTTFTRMAIALPGRTTRAGLTGGKDSRLILALLVGDGSAGDVEFETFGEDDLPDVIVARHIAESLGLRHVVNANRAEAMAWRKGLDAAMRDAGHGDASAREIGFRLTAWACSGSRDVFGVHPGRPPSGHRTLFSGNFGETLRTNFEGSTRFRSKERVAGLPEDLGLGSAGILRPEVLAHYRDETHRLLFDGCVESDSPQDIADLFYLRNWLRRWFGHTMEIDAQSRVAPLYSPTAIRLAFAIGGENRHAEWIHYELIRRSYEPLLHMDFAGRGWPAATANGLVRPRTHRDRIPKRPFPARGDAGKPSKPSNPKRTVVSDRRSKAEAVDLEIMRRYLRHDPTNPVFDVIDPVATNRLLDGFATLPERQKLQLYGALTAAIWLGGHEIELPRSVSSK